MSDIFNRFEVFEKVDQILKQRIKIFHVFDDKNGYNVLFITSDDKVYGFGQNIFGCCGLGHNNVVEEPQLIPELCQKSVKQFFIGYDFVMAINNDNQVFGWGRNDWGQLGRGYTNSQIEMKPEIISDFKVLHLSCGSCHCLALTPEGIIYGWGCNTYRQIGNGYGCFNTFLNSPTMLTYFTKYLIKSLHCSYCTSFAITSDGLVFSWGYNNWCQLGHKLNKDKVVYEPKLINNLSNILINNF